MHLVRVKPLVNTGSSLSIQLRWFTNRKEAAWRTRGNFFFENSFYTDYESFRSGEPSRQNVDALEKTELLLLRKQDLDALYEENPKFERFGRLMAEQAYLGVRKRNSDLLNLSPEDRYRELLEKRPKVMQRIPQH
jgi:CRP-like cAMP-binding protein